MLERLHSRRRSHTWLVGRTFCMLVLKNGTDPISSTSRWCVFVDGVPDYQLIDKTWMIAKAANSGPFGSIDQNWITTAYNKPSPTSTQFRGIDEVFFQVSGNAGGARLFVLLGHVSE